MSEYRTIESKLGNYANVYIKVGVFTEDEAEMLDCEVTTDTGTYTGGEMAINENLWSLEETGEFDIEMDYRIYQEVVKFCESQRS